MSLIISTNVYRIIYNKVTWKLVQANVSAKMCTFEIFRIGVGDKDWGLYILICNLSLFRTHTLIIQFLIVSFFKTWFRVRISIIYTMKQLRFACVWHIDESNRILKPC